MARSPKFPSNEASPAVTFSPEKLAELVNEITEGRKTIAALTAAIAAKTQAANTKPTKASKAGPAPATSSEVKTERAVQNELLCIRAFKKAGYGVVVPHVDVRTFNRWQAVGLRPVEGSKSVRAGNLRLFHKSQCRVITQEETARNVEQQKAAIDRHTADLVKTAAPAAKAAKAKAAKTAKVVPINANPQ